MNRNWFTIDIIINYRPVSSMQSTSVCCVKPTKSIQSLSVWSNLPAKSMKAPSAYWSTYKVYQVAFSMLFHLQSLSSHLQYALTYQQSLWSASAYWSTCKVDASSSSTLTIKTALSKHFCEIQYYSEQTT